ncbi:MAG: DUF4347 domain-containing protein, partial [Salaquimonas sp.]
MGIKSGLWGAVKNRLSSSSTNDQNSIIRQSAANGHLHLASLGQPLSEVQSQRLLEPRILLDAAGFETGSTVMDSVAAEQSNQLFLTKTVCPPPPNVQLPFINGTTEDLRKGVAVGESLLTATTTVSPPPPSSDLLFFSRSTFGDQEPLSEPGVVDTSLIGFDASVGDLKPSSIVFIDANVKDIETIIASISDDSEIVILTADSDGVEQIAEHLKNRSDVDAIHVISHGRSGTLDLGNAKLTALSIAGKHADEMAVIRNALSENADILLYGCDFAAGTRGANAISALAGATGADIAASEDLTGAALLGGDWDLEVQTGDIDAYKLAAPEWSGLLAALTISTTAQPTLVGSAVPLGIPDSVTAGQQVIWANAGFVGGTPVDLIATVVSVDPGVHLAFLTQADDPTVALATGVSVGGSTLG